MARSLVNNEVLYFLENNLSLSENDSFVNNIVEFYSFEDIDNAIKALKNELVNLKIEKIEKFQPRGNRKIEKLFECIFIMKYLKENKYWEKCSIFVSSNLNKAPNVEINKPLWSDAYDSPISDDVQPFLLVYKRKKSQQLSNNSKADNKPKLSTNKVADSKTVEKKPVRIIGQKILDNGKLKADKELIKKSVFCLSNISKCLRNDVVEYLTTNGIRVLSCYPVVKQFKKKSTASENSIDNNTVNYSDDKTKDDIESSMFRVCIDRNDVKKIKNPAILPQHIIVREWQLNKKAEVTVEKTKKDG
ncbi:hypothetical protein HELRODRAFT_175912 [Helobdella robusta]|uniref:Uncharacterized protein n=1 Tax=Helobdella robusta TaxID=6412 RepID=T1F9V5_HELRO|nr:hypothetical protein HELRODRAFT_175912 [Helobdella robusta]ESO00471.1 hypothetical protein HELRODRAFT_175912 [Helobdella robusta]